MELDTKFLQLPYPVVVKIPLKFMDPERDPDQH